MNKERLEELLNGRDVNDVCDSLQQCWADMEDHHSGYYPDERIDRMYADTEIACAILKELGN